MRRFSDISGNSFPGFSNVKFPVFMSVVCENVPHSQDKPCHAYLSAVQKPFSVPSKPSRIENPNALYPRTLWNLGFLAYFSGYPDVPNSRRSRHDGPMITPSRVYRMILNEKDALLAMEIFEVASQEPGFHNNYSAYHELVLKLCRAKQFKLMDDLILRMKKDGIPYTPGLFSEIIEMYGEFKMPNEAVKMFHRMLKVGCKPLAMHLNSFLRALVENKCLDIAFSIFKKSREYGIEPDTMSYNILMRAKCHNNQLSHAYFLFNQMVKKGLCRPDAESYSILMQGLCRKSQVQSAIGLLDEMVNKGHIPEPSTYTTLLNSLCRKKNLREAYRLLCKMKVMGCNPDVVNYNTVITGFCREGRAHDACEVLRDMPNSGCLPNMFSYRTLITGLCNQGEYDMARDFLQEMISKGFTQHVSMYHLLICGFCNQGRIRDACRILETLISQNIVPHTSTWNVILSNVCEDRNFQFADLVDNLMQYNNRHDS